LVAPTLGGWASVRQDKRVESSEAPERLRSLTTWLLAQNSLRAARAVTEGLADVGAHRHHYSMLAVLAETGPVSQAELGRRCGLDRSDVTSAVTELESAGLLTRNPAPGDRRRNEVALTRSGTRRLRQLDRAVAAIQDQVLEPLTTTERAALNRLLSRLLELP
jgi:DNA-binding MarR family transcriptional regulator